MTTLGHDREDEPCHNYSCCGLQIDDLHALVQQFEEVHVVVVDQFDRLHQQSPLPPSPTTRQPVLITQFPNVTVPNSHLPPPPPPDLTPYIARDDDQYIAGGCFGDVYKCWYHNGSPKEVAVKAFRFTFSIDGDANNRSTKMVRRELGIWRRLDHANVVPFMGIAYGFGMRGAMSLVSLWMHNGTLHHFLEKHADNLSVQHRLKFLLDIANGLYYLHSFPIVHGDLNCNNVLLDADYTARLADFGYASLVGSIPEVLSYLQRSTTRPGALRWSSPEQMEPKEAFHRTTKSDIYSFGCIALQESCDGHCCQVLSGKPPWSEIREDMAVVLQLARGHKPGRPASRTLSDVHWRFIQQCWLPAKERPDAQVTADAMMRFLRTPTPPPCQTIQVSSVYTPSCPTSPSMVPMINHGVSHPDRNCVGTEPPSSSHQASMDGSSTHVVSVGPSGSPPSIKILDTDYTPGPFDPTMIEAYRYSFDALSHLDRLSHLDWNCVGTEPPSSSHQASIDGSSTHVVSVGPSGSPPSIKILDTDDMSGLFDLTMIEAHRHSSDAQHQDTFEQLFDFENRLAAHHGYETSDQCTGPLRHGSHVYAEHDTAFTLSSCSRRGR